MIRYVVTLPERASPEIAREVAEQIGRMANARSWRDVILSSGVSIVDMRRKTDNRRAFLSRARSKVR